MSNTIAHTVTIRNEVEAPARELDLGIAAIDVAAIGIVYSAGADDLRVSRNVLTGEDTSIGIVYSAGADDLRVTRNVLMVG